MTGNTFFFGWEVSLIEWLQAALGSVGVTLSSVVSLLGEEMLLIGILGFLYWCWDKEQGRYVTVAVLSARIWSVMAKNVFRRRRPYMDHESIRCQRAPEAGYDIYDINAQGFSFPSGHATNTAALFSAIALWVKKRWTTVLAIVIPLVVSLSRLILGVHYPTDVLIGWGLGAASVALVWVLWKRVPRRVLYLILALTGLPGLFFCTSSDYFTSYGMMLGMFAGSMFEEKYVKFENTRSPIRCILRVAGGVVLYLGMNALLKLPFSSAWLEGGTMAANLVRAARYLIICFLGFGVYPMVFKYTAKG